MVVFVVAVFLLVYSLISFFGMDFSVKNLFLSFPLSSWLGDSFASHVKLKVTFYQTSLEIVLRVYVQKDLSVLLSKGRSIVVMILPSVLIES